MKAEIEMNGFEIVIEEIEGKVSIKVEKNNDTIEEIVLDPSEYEDEVSSEEELPEETEEGAEEDVEEEVEEEGLEESIMSFDTFLKKK